MKSLKRIDKVIFTLILTGCFAAMSCQNQQSEMSQNGDQNSETSPSTPVTRNDYLIFGHVSGFCLNCDVLYKIENDSIYTTKFCTNLDPGTAVFSFLKAVDDNSPAGELTREIPSKLLNEQNTFIGAPRPDVGHYYFEVKIGGKIKHWYVEAAGVPDYLTSYMADVKTVMNNLR